MNADSRTEARREIFARLRRAKSEQSGGQVRAALESIDAAPAPGTSGSSLIDQFIANVERHGGSTDIVDSKTAIAQSVAGFLYQQQRVRKLVIGADPRLAAIPWRDGGVLPRFDTVEDGDFSSISYATAAVAETGSIVLLSGKSNPSRNHLLVDNHIVLVAADTLLATLDGAWDWLDCAFEEHGRPRGVYFISGPSSTADIDMQLVRGAHGPKHWHVIVVKEQGPAS